MPYHHLQNTGYVTRPRATVSEFNYFLSRGVGQRSAVDEYTAELVHSTVT